MDKITVLTCQNGYKATKRFICRPDNKIEKIAFKAGMFFSHEEKEISSLQDLANILDDLLDKPSSFVIRGKPSLSIKTVTRRRNEFFDSASRQYVMLDIDKLPCPAHFDVTINSEEAIKWILEHLPAPFRKSDCYYTFSSSQNMSTDRSLSVHIWFWLASPASNEEWKRYFKANPAPVDLALFSNVQIHYTARPVFEGMNDPLPKRSGILKGERHSVSILDIPDNVKKSAKPRLSEEPKVTLENRQSAIQLILPFYKEGIRNKLCSAIAGALYRGGWNRDNTADFLFELAETGKDEEADARYSNALRICDAVERGHLAQGIPTLKEHIDEGGLKEMLNLLGVGKPDIKAVISSLFDVNDLETIKEAMKIIITLPESEQKSCLDKVSKLTGRPKSVLKDLLKEAKIDIASSPADWADITMEIFLRHKFDNGRLLLRAKDGQYWKYNGRYWEVSQREDIKSLLLPCARATVVESEGKSGGASSLMKAVLDILEGRVYRADNPLHTQEVPAVINCLNGELWFDETGKATLKPHRAESYLKHCLNVNYNPNANSPLFDKAILEIFANSNDPADMVRHFLELAGYICQPWRKIPVIALLYGHGSNGKSSLISIVQRVLGLKMIMSDRIGNMEDKDFKIGALDGKLLLLDDDVDEGTCLPDGFLKKISEEKLVSGQHKHKPIFEFVCRAVPVMLANNYPATKDLSYGVQRRMHIIPFQRQFTKEEIKVGLFDEIWEKEASGILNRFVEGFQRLRKRERFLQPEDCINSKNEWIRRANILPAFIEESCDLGDDSVQALGDLYSVFRTYCSDNGVKYIPAQNTVGDRIEKLGYVVTMLNGKKHIRGLHTKKTPSGSIDFRQT